jgi:3-hydroxyisobutyrate dehydrogenase-like beta-hydroxyacid dehydrogenase
MEVGFIGVGMMGLPIALNLLKAGVRLTVFNRTASKAQPLVANGATQVGSPADTAAPGGVVMTMLANDEAVEAMVVGDEGLAVRLAPGGIHVSMSTIAPATARHLAHYHAERGSIYVASPIFGRPDNAAARRLVICTSGPAAAKESVRPLLESVSLKIFDFGEEPGAANVMKVAGNFLIAAALESMAEAFTMAEQNGVDRKKVAEALATTLFACPVYQGYAEMIAAKRHTPAGFKLSLGLKDIELVQKTAAEVRVAMPVAALVHERLIAALAHGREDMDWSALALGVLDDAGIN